MKNSLKYLLFSTCLLLVIYSCCENKKPNNTSTLVTPKAASCSDLTDYKNITRVSDKADWLKKNGKNVCPDLLYSTTLIEHMVSVNNYRVTVDNQTTPLSIPFKAIKDSIGNHKFYEYYLNFYIKDNKVTFRKLTKFDENQNCYSIVLFKAIEKYMNLDVRSKIEFKSAKIETPNDTLNKIIIVIPGRGNLTLDISQIPKSL
ncbi:hypothetical protein NBRC110019_06970 [Neptunitalea chrysea]|uniref:Lipoprotein n=1 Tax=Neptunitalea chrysea TaxID=1647581 RepID=A0A9W6B6K9_9FLAO|nr:hypothetical protein [Neptunitalea chrysea]GLB51658.1 hypothetical protein NBRC110019_06970 [Neptunitalea chrysea]